MKCKNFEDYQITLKYFQPAIGSALSVEGQQLTIGKLLGISKILPSFSHHHKPWSSPSLIHSDIYMSAKLGTWT